MVIRPQAPQKLKNMDFYIATKNVLLIRFQQDLNHYLEIILSQDMISSIICQSGQTGLLDFSLLGDKSDHI